MDSTIALYRLAETGQNVPVQQHGAVIATTNWISGRYEDIGGSDYALLGDAAGLADSATGEGIDYAFRSAKLAVDSFDEALGFAAYPAEVRMAFDAEVRRARLLRRLLYLPGVIEGWVRWARSSARGTQILTALADAINEHGSVKRALLGAIVSRPTVATLPRAVSEHAGPASVETDAPRDNAGRPWTPTEFINT
jgi:flavin-dependent dehydrogenase